VRVVQSTLQVSATLHRPNREAVPPRHDNSPGLRREELQHFEASAREGEVGLLARMEPEREKRVLLHAMGGALLPHPHKVQEARLRPRGPQTRLGGRSVPRQGSEGEP